MTGDQLVREYFPTATAEQVESLLWGGTCFPMLGGDDEAITKYREQLKHLQDASKGNPAVACQVMEKEFDEELKSIKEETCSSQHKHRIVGPK